MENTGRLMLRTNATVQKLENYVAQESNLMGDFVKEIKHYVEKHVHKKIIKLYTSDGQWKKEDLIN